jgi:hypothetical protein
MIRRRYFTGVEVILGICILLGGASGMKHYKDKRKMRNMAEENAEQAQVIDKLVIDLTDINKKKDEAEAKHEEAHKEVKKKAAEGFSVLYEQSIDVHDENKTDMTAEHLDTAKRYVEVWGYEAMSKVIKWQHEALVKHAKESKEAMEREQKLRAEYETFKQEQYKRETELLAQTEKHKNDAQSLSSKVKEFTAQNSWLDNIIFWLIVGLGGYVFISLGGFGMLAKARSNAVESAQHYRRKKNQMVKAVKTFTLVDSDGNKTMQNIIDASDDLDMEEEPEDESPVKTLKNKRKIWKKNP